MPKQTKKKSISRTPPTEVHTEDTNHAYPVINLDNMERDQLKIFLNSPLGKKMISLGPQIFQEVSALAEQYIIEKLNEILGDRDTSFSLYT